MLLVEREIFKTGEFAVFTQTAQSIPNFTTRCSAEDLARKLRCDMLVRVCAGRNSAGKRREQGCEMRAIPPSGHHLVDRHTPQPLVGGRGIYAHVRGNLGNAN